VTKTRNVAHLISLSITLVLAWLYVGWAANIFSDSAYLAMVKKDFSGLGAARADFTLQIMFLPVLGLLAYAAIRFAIAGGQWIFDFAVSIRGAQRSR
jgi:uncharacterized membrane protein